MSIAANPFGMRPTRKQAAGSSTQGFETHPIASGYATAINFGDLVRMDTNGTILKETGTTSALPIGVFLGCEYTDGQGRRQFAQSWPAGQVSAEQAFAKVTTDPTDVFNMQADGSLTQAAVGANAALVQNAGALGLSKNALQASSVATTATLPLRIVGIVERPDNAPGDAFTEVLVKINTHQYSAPTGV